MYQQITLVGNLGGDPTMAYTPSGAPVTNFSVAVSRKWTDPDGKVQERTTWFRVNVWRKLAETCQQYLTKGQRVLVVGEVEEPRIWTDGEGKPRTSLQVTAYQVKFLTAKAEKNGNDEKPWYTHREPGGAAARPSADNVDNGEEVDLWS